MVFVVCGRVIFYCVVCICGRGVWGGLVVCVCFGFGFLRGFVCVCDVCVCVWCVLCVCGCVVRTLVSLSLLFVPVLSRL